MLSGKRRQRVRRHVVLARGAADGEQPLLQMLQLGRIEIGIADRRLRRVAGGIQRDERGVDCGDARLDELRRLRQPSVEPPQRAIEAGHEPIGGEHFDGVTQVADDLLRGLHVVAPLGQHQLLAGLDGELVQLGVGVAEVVGLGADRGDARLLRATLLAEAVSRISRSPDRKTSTSPGASRSSSCDGVDDRPRSGRAVSVLAGRRRRRRCRPAVPAGGSGSRPGRCGPDTSTMGAGVPSGCAKCFGEAAGARWSPR